MLSRAQPNSQPPLNQSSMDSKDVLERRLRGVMSCAECQRSSISFHGFSDSLMYFAYPDSKSNVIKRFPVRLAQ
jgi:hypothetical protein